jgi:lysophospholipase L1-like esterase
MRRLPLALAALLAIQAENPAEPFPRSKEYPWMSVAAWKGMHEAMVKRAKEGNIDLVFLGDSITQGWGNNAVWQKYYGTLNAVNFGIGGDTTQNVLWRITNGEIEGLSPKVVVLMIGTNNFGLNGDSIDGVAKGVAAVVQTIRKRLPKTRVLLLGVFPRDEKPKTDGRNKIAKLNEQLARMEDRKSVRYLDLGPKFLQPDGSITKEIMPDFLHLSEKGYQIWAESMDPLLREMLK